MQAKENMKKREKFGYEWILEKKEEEKEEGWQPSEEWRDQEDCFLHHSWCYHSDSKPGIFKNQSNNLENLEEKKHLNV